MRKVPLTQGKWAWVDDEDFERVSQYKWSCEFSRGTWYGKCSNVNVGRQKKTLRLHQFVARYWGGKKKVDHINGRGWDCRKLNLRVVTERLNSANRAPLKGCASKYKGVTLDKRCGRWRAQLLRKHIGYFDTERAAAAAYDLVAIRKFGENARLNFPQTVTYTLVYGGNNGN